MEQSHVSDDVSISTSEVEDLPSTVAAFRLISEYQQITGDIKYTASLYRGFSFLKTFWNEELGIFNDMLSGTALRLRASPRDYHIYSFLCVASLRKVYPEAAKFVKPLYRAVKNNFEAMTSDTYPLLYGTHAAVIANTEGDSEYVTVVKKIFEEISVKSRFQFQIARALGHRMACVAFAWMRDT